MENNTENNTDTDSEDKIQKKAKLKKNTVISFFAIAIITAFVIGIFIIQLKREKIPRGAKAPNINEYKIDTDFSETFGATSYDAKKILKKNLSIAYNKDEVFFLIFKNFINFEYRYLYAYPFYCEKQGIDLSLFKERFNELNSEVIKKTEEVLFFNNKLEEYKESIYNNPALKEFLYNSIENEFKEIISNTTLKPIDLCETFNNPLQKDDSFVYKMSFPENTDYILKYRINNN